jgi:hypothetical protein
MPGWRPWKVDYADGSPASDVAAMMIPFFGHVGGKERTLGDFGVGGVSAPAAPDRVSEAYLGDSGRGRKTGSGTKVFSSESSVLRHHRRRCLRVSLPSWGADATTFSMIGLRVKTLDHRSRQQRRGSSLPSWGRCRGAPVHPGLGSLSLVASVILICFVRGLPITLYHLADVALFIKRGESLFRERVRARLVACTSFLAPCGQALGG